MRRTTARLDRSVCIMIAFVILWIALDDESSFLDADQLATQLLIVSAIQARFTAPPDKPSTNFLMDKVSLFREYAAECRALASRAQSARQRRRAFCTLATTWESVASHRERTLAERPLSDENK